MAVIERHEDKGHLWTDLLGDVLASGSLASKTDPKTTTNRFYRIQVLPYTAGVHAGPVWIRLGTSTKSTGEEAR
jgi:hypothetical protein